MLLLKTFTRLTSQSNIFLEFSDKELIQLAKLLQDKIDAYDTRVPVEEYDMVLLPVELLDEQEPSNDHLLRTLVRDRRSPQISEDDDETVPIIVIPEEEVASPQENQVHSFFSLFTSFLVSNRTRTRRSTTSPRRPRSSCDFIRRWIGRVGVANENSGAFGDTQRTSFTGSINISFSYRSFFTCP